MSLDVLFIDDDLSLATEWALYIGDTMQLKTAATDDPDEALDRVTRESIRICVIDQRMPRTSGVELGRALKERDARCRRIMMSGEATNTEVSDAYDSGFERFVHKNDAIARLPGYISQLLLEYYGDIVRERRNAAPDLAFSVGAGPFWKRTRTRFSLLSVDEVDHDHILEGSWSTPVRVDAGMTIERTVEVNWSVSMAESVALEERSRVSAGLSVPLVNKFSAMLQAELRQTRAFSGSVNHSHVHRATMKYELPSEPVDPNALYIKARSYQVSPAYVRISCSVSAECLHCHVDEIWKTHVLLPSRRYATRQIDYLSDGTEKVHLTGFNDV